MLAELETWNNIQKKKKARSLIIYTFLGSPGDWDNLDILEEEETTDPAESLLLFLPGADVELSSELL